MNDPVREWAREYSEGMGDVPKSHHPSGQRARLLFAYRRRQKAGLFAKAELSALQYRALQFALAGGVLVLTGTLLWRAAAPIASGDSAPTTAERSLPPSEEVTVGKRITTAEVPRTVTFPSGTRLLWNRNSSGTVSKLSSSTVELTLDDGSLDMDVQRQAGRTWVVRSGKFRIYVIGTAFTVSREGHSEELKVKVLRGQVRIEGPDIAGGKILLGANEEFGWRPQLAAPSVAKGTPPPPIPVPSSPPKSAKPHAKPRLSHSWQAFARSGKYELALEEVEKLGTESVLASSSADDRLLLGNAARYSGRLELGTRAYLAARELGGAAAPLAAYYLAKIALDTNGDQSGAIRWLKTYLREAPSGDLAPSARARLMNLLQSSGNQAEAESVARDYLALHPTGPNVQTARKLLELP